MSEPSPPVAAHAIATVRAFNRDYTRRIGVLPESMLDTPYSLTDLRVLYEIAHRRDVTAAELASDLGLDRGYLSRILKQFGSAKLLAQDPSPSDGRRRHLRLTPEGRTYFARINAEQERQVAQMLSELNRQRLDAVLTGMQAIQSAFAPAPMPPAGTATRPTLAPAPTPPGTPVTLRPHKPGDMGWVIERHGTLYFDEYGFDESFEALVAQIASDFITKLQPSRERCWIAERDGQRLGCIFLVSSQDNTTAKLRLLLVDPQARGLGVGRQLVTACVQFARSAGYREIVLWTQQNLFAARHLYQQAGFVKASDEPHHSFGCDLVAETWKLNL
jgi:DNA-binding MarR family transcriptional regulator/GNAT superfamily N-acetyltransferase